MIIVVTGSSRDIFGIMVIVMVGHVTCRETVVIVVTGSPRDMW